MIPSRELNPLRSLDDGVLGVSLYTNQIVDFGDVDEWEFGPDDSFTIAVQFIARSMRNAGIFGRCNNSDLVRNWTWDIYLYGWGAVGFGMGDGSNYLYFPQIDRYYTYRRMLIVITVESYGKVRVYSNGVLKGEKTRNIGQLRQTTDKFNMGLRASNYYFDGWIISAYIWKRVLSEDEIKDLYFYWDDPPKDNLIFFVFPNTIDKFNMVWRNKLDYGFYGVIEGDIDYVSQVNPPSKRNLVV